MSYVLDHLLKGERVVYQAKVHWTVYFSLKGLFTLFIWPWIHRKTSEFAVTNRRVIIKIGVLDRRTLELNLSKVESVEVDQTLWGRMFGYGELEVIGTGGTREKFVHVGNPLGFRKAVAEATNAQEELRLPAQAPQTADTAPADPQARLQRAQEMAEKGLITQEEFAEVRKRILAEM